MKHRGRPHIQTVPFNPEFLDYILNLRGISLRSINNDPILAASEKTIRRAKKERKINPEIRDRLGQKLNVNPILFSLNLTRDQYESMSFDDKKYFHMVDSSKEGQYAIKKYQERDFLSFVEYPLVRNGLSLDDYYNLPSNKQLGFLSDLSGAALDIVKKYFS